MSASAARWSTGDETSGKVVPIRRASILESTGNTGIGRLYRDALATNMLVDQMKAAVENAIFESISRGWTTIQPSEESPFDSIYLADLMPDTIRADDMQLLATLSSIQDKSSEIEFADGWDD